MKDLVRVLIRYFLVFERIDYLAAKKRLRLKSLNFSLSPNYLGYPHCSVSFELFYRKILNLGILSNEDLDFVKTSVKETAVSSY